jgi:hypothetical protein
MFIRFPGTMLILGYVRQCSKGSSCDLSSRSISQCHRLFTPAPPEALLICDILTEASQGLCRGDWSELIPKLFCLGFESFDLTELVPFFERGKTLINVRLAPLQ